MTDLTQFQLEDYGYESAPILECSKCGNYTGYTTATDFSLKAVIELAEKHTCKKPTADKLVWAWDWYTGEPTYRYDQEPKGPEGLVTQTFQSLITKEVAALRTSLDNLEKRPDPLEDIVEKPTTITFEKIYGIIPLTIQQNPLTVKRNEPLEED